MFMRKNKYKINEKEVIEKTRLSESSTVSVMGNVFRIENKKINRYNTGIDEVNGKAKAIFIVLATVFGTIGGAYIILTLLSLLSSM